MPIMIVEDNAVSAKLVECLLQKAGYQTVVVTNGKEALASLPTLKNVQLIITDFMMPEMDGLELIAKIKVLPAFRDIPTIILSAHCDVATVRAARGLDCESFLVKPVEKSQLLERVEHVLRDQPLVLRDKTHIMDTLQVWAEEYDDLIGMLAVQVNTAIPLVVLEQSESQEPMSPQLSQSLNELAESAALMGADKFATLHSRLVETKSMTRTQLPALLKALQDLEAALPARTVSSPNEEPPQQRLAS